MELDLESAVNYHYDQFPPKRLEILEKKIPWPSAWSAGVIRKTSESPYSYDFH